MRNNYDFEQLVFEKAEIIKAHDRQRKRVISTVMPLAAALVILTTVGLRIISFTPNSLAERQDVAGTAISDFYSGNSRKPSANNSQKSMLDENAAQEDAVYPDENVEQYNEESKNNSDAAANSVSTANASENKASGTKAADANKTDDGQSANVNKTDNAQVTDANKTDNTQAADVNKTDDAQVTDANKTADTQIAAVTGTTATQTAGAKCSDAKGVTAQDSNNTVIFVADETIELYDVAAEEIRNAFSGIPLYELENQSDTYLGMIIIDDDKYSIFSDHVEVTMYDETVGSFVLDDETKIILENYLPINFG